MKKLFKYIYTVFICLLLLVTPLKVYANGINFNQGSITVEVNSTTNMQYVIEEGLNHNEISWSSSNESVAVINNGVLTAVSEGTTIITATVNGYSSTCKVTVKSSDIKVTGIKLNKSNTSLLVGATETLKVTIEPSDASNKSVIWSSSNPEVATISNGIITAKSVGITIITASVGGYNATCKVQVTYSMSLKGISLNKTNITIKEKENIQLSVVYNPTSATNKKVTWKSSNSNIVKVNSSGLVTAVAKGSATITVVSNDGGYVATCKVTVEEIEKKVTKVELDKKELKMLTGETTSIKETVYPDYAENKNVIWSSSDEKIAVVKDGKITAKTPGTVEIKVTTVDGDKEAICKVTITSPPVESIEFKESEYTVFVGTEINLTILAKPENAVLTNAIWKSSEETVANVIDGTVQALTPGETEITVTNQDGTLSASTKIIVQEKTKEAFKIEIEGYKLKFDSEQLNYVLKIGKEKELNIKTNVSQDEVIIKGNQNLTKGSIITITHTENPDVVYVIEIQQKKNYTIYYIAVISLLLLFNLIRILIKNKKKEDF